MANSVNYGEKYNHRLTLRLTDSQFDFLVSICRVMDVTPSDYLRMVISSAQYAYDNGTLFSDFKDKVGMQNENVEADFNNKL